MGREKQLIQNLTDGRFDGRSLAVEIGRQQVQLNFPLNKLRKTSRIRNVGY